jgi:hypothetical protein
MRRFKNRDATLGDSRFVAEKMLARADHGPLHYTSRTPR